MQPKYPFVVCGRGGDHLERSYMVCEHVMRGAKITHLLQATDVEMGEALCGSCDQMLSTFERTNRALPKRILSMMLVICECCLGSLRKVVAN
jgi:hypothetical protein